MSVSLGKRLFCRKKRFFAANNGEVILLTAKSAELLALAGVFQSGPHSNVLALLVVGLASVVLAVFLRTG